MAKPILVRKSFNAGELSPELHYRDDLAAYVKGCKHLTNMIATPYGAVTRRPPMELLAKIDKVLYGIPIRYIPFKFSLTEVFHIIFTDGSGTESTDSTTADLIIFDSNGSQVIFDGTPGTLSSLPGVLPVTLNAGFVAMVTTVYDPADLDEIHFINVNDFVYMSCGAKYPIQAINRFFDIDEGGNRWKIEEFEFKGGPFLEPNTNAGETLMTTLPAFDYNETYPAGSEVWGIVPGDSVYSFTLYSLGGGLYRAYLQVTAHGLDEGDKFQLDGVLLSGAVDCFFNGTNELADGFLNGEYTVTDGVSTNGFYFNLYIRLESGGTLPSDDVSGAEFWPSSEYGSFYRASQEAFQKTLTNTTYWEPFDRYTGSLELTSNVSRFLPTDVGRLVEMSSENVEGTADSYEIDGASVPIIAGSLVELTTAGGAWGGKLALQESKDGGLTWEDIGTIESTNGSFNGSIERDITEPSSLVRVKLTGYVEAASSFVIKACQWQLKTPSGISEIYKITEYTDENTVTAVAITPIDRPRTDYRWSLGAWSGTSGYPYSLTIHDERLVFGGCVTKPNTVYASRVNEWDNFLGGLLETSPYDFTIASDSFDAIRSLKSSRQLNVFTDNSENTMGSRDDNAVTSVTNIAVSSHTNYGSSDVQAIQMADMIWFVMGQSERVRASRYDFASDGQQSIEMSLFASHITASGIKEMSFRRHPFNTLFCLLNNGTAAALTYEGMQEVKAWSTYSTVGGDIISAASNYSDEGDIVAGIVKRGDDYFLEVFGSNDAQTVFLDNQTKWTGQDFTIGQPIEQTDDGLLVVIHDDAVLTAGDDYTIAGGVLTIPTVTTGAVAIGRAFVSRVNPTDISEVAPSGMVKRLTELGLYLLDSGTCTVKINGKESPFTDGLKLGAGDRISGLFDMETGGDYDQGLDIDITISNHRHFTLTGLGYRLSVSDG